MKKLINHVLTIILISAIALGTTGCEMQIFEDKDAKYRLQEVSREELKNEIFYIKEGTKFYEVHNCEGSSGNSQDLDATKCVWTVLDEMKIPSYYKGELLAYASQTTDLEEVTLERFKDTGFSLGIYGAKFEDGYISFDQNENTIKNTSARKELKNDRSQSILIETINGIPVSEKMLNEAGVIVGLEKNKDYNITFYAGTYYGEITVKAETHFYQSYEAFKLHEFEITKNGYIAISLPEDYKSGFYRVNGQGMFKYYDFKKGERQEKYAEMNTKYYQSEEEQMAAYSQQYTFNLEATTKNASIVAVYDPNTLISDYEKVKMMVTSPDGKKMMVESGKDINYISCDMAESLAGKWIVNISPQSLIIADVQIVSNEVEPEATKEVFNIPIDVDRTGIIFRVEYEGEGNVTAQVVAPDNKSYDMKPVEMEEHKLEYNFPFLSAGAYQINVYHYPDTKILSTDYYFDEATNEVDIISVEE